MSPRSIDQTGPACAETLSVAAVSNKTMLRQQRPSKMTSRVRVFVSSTVEGFAAHREAARKAIEQAGWRMYISAPAGIISSLRTWKPGGRLFQTKAS